MARRRQAEVLHPRATAAWLLVPLAAAVLMYPQQSLRLFVRLSATVRAFALGMQLKDDLQRVLSAPR